MKKIFSLLAVVLMAAGAQAALGLSVNGTLVNKDTTIVVNTVEVDDFTGDLSMKWEGMMFYNGQLTVYIERSQACVENHEDEFCAGMCITGTTGELNDTVQIDGKLYQQPLQIYAHYYPMAAEVQTIRYRFVGGGEDFVLTVEYDSRAAMAIEQQSVNTKSQKVIRNGQVVILRGGVAFDLLGNKVD